MWLMAAEMWTQQKKKKKKPNEDQSIMCYLVQQCDYI